MTDTPTFDAAELAFIASYADKLEKRARIHPRMCVLLGVLSLLMTASGLVCMASVMAWFEPQPTILDRIDNPPPAGDLPPVLRVSGESRKGLLLLEKQSQLQMLDLMLFSVGLLMVFTGCKGVAWAISHRHDDRRDRILLKLLRAWAVPAATADSVASGAASS